jgi:hypothetical protein
MIWRRKIRTKRKVAENWKTKRTMRHSMEISPWKRLWVCRRIDYEMKERNKQRNKELMNK